MALIFKNIHIDLCFIFVKRRTKLILRQTHLIKTQYWLKNIDVYLVNLFLVAMGYALKEPGLGNSILWSQYNLLYKAKLNIVYF